MNTILLGVLIANNADLNLVPRAFFRFLNIWTVREISPGYLWPITKFRNYTLSLYNLFINMQSVVAPFR